MADRFSVTSSDSWFSRLGKALAGVAVGLVLFAAAFPLLWWNEGRAVHRARSLEEGASIVRSVAADAVDAANEGRLVHLTALATSDETLADPDFGIAAVSALRLERVAETYQWKEESSTQKRKKIGGGEETTTTYRYAKTWSRHRIDSGRFHEPQGHENPQALRWEPATLAAGRVAFGAFTLPPELASKIDRRQPRPIQPGDETLMAEHGCRPVEDGWFYHGANASSPHVGDVRVRFDVTLPETVSIVAEQRGSTFAPYQARAGSAIHLLEEGTVPAAQMFASAQAANTVTTWLLRLAFFVAMFVGLLLVLRPISMAGSVLPFVGSLLGAGAALASFLLAAVLSLITIAMAWLFYRPLLGGALLAAAAGAVYLLVKTRRKPAAPPPLPPTVPPPIPTGV
jgi:hypothetical protein